MACRTPTLRTGFGSNPICGFYAKPWFSLKRIPGTVFSTITVNRNFRTALHQDAGDFKEGLSVLAVFTRGDVRGGDLCLPEYGVSVPMGHGDLLLFHAHLWHCNTPITGTHEHAIKPTDPARVSLVCYLREKMHARCTGVDPHASQPAHMRRKSAGKPARRSTGRRRSAPRRRSGRRSAPRPFKATSAIRAGRA